MARGRRCGTEARHGASRIARANVRSEAMRAGVRRVVFVVAVSAAVACSLTDLTGLSESDPVETPEASAVDSAVDVVVVTDAAPDVVPPPCEASTVIDTPLTVDLGTWSPRAFAQSGHPKVETFFGTSAAVLFPFVDTTPVLVDAGDPDADAGPTYSSAPEITSASSGLWQTTPVALGSFDAEFEVHVRCTKPSSCADGVAFAWLGTTVSSALASSNIGAAVGLPGAVEGAAVLLDDFQNDPTEIADPAPPTLQIIQLDPAKTPGKYTWILTSKSASFLGGWHKVKVALRGTTLSVSYDGAFALTATVKPLFRGLVGITAGTGGLTDAVAVRKFKGSFYDCVP